MGPWKVSFPGTLSSFYICGSTGIVLSNLATLYVRQFRGEHSAATYGNSEVPNGRDEDFASVLDSAAGLLVGLCRDVSDLNPPSILVGIPPRFGDFGLEDGVALQDVPVRSDPFCVVSDSRTVRKEILLKYII